MRKKIHSIIGFQVAVVLSLGLTLHAQQKSEEELPLASPEQMWERLQKTLPPFSYTVKKDEVVRSDTDPRQKLRRIELRFISQEIDGVKMGQTGVIFMRADNSENLKPERKGKVVIVTHYLNDDTIELNYAEPIAARTGYPTMSLLMPGDNDGAKEKRDWLLYFRRLARDTQDPSNHDLF